MQPFTLPTTLKPPHARALAYWEGLLRGSAPMPFWDDLVLDDLGDLQRDAFTLEVFDKPERFRFGLIGETLKQATGEIEGDFLGDGKLPEPFGFLLSQASATVEAARPTFHAFPGEPGYARLLLPMWGDGRIGLILGVVATP